MEKGFKIELYDSYYELTEKIGVNNISVIDENHNKYICIYSEVMNPIGIAYFDYGIPVKTVHTKEYVYIGIGKKVFCFSNESKEAFTIFDLNSVFYDFILDNNMIIFLCELDVYCYWGTNLLWKYEFNELVSSGKLIEDNLVQIICEDNSEYCIGIKDGKIQ